MRQALFQPIEWIVWINDVILISFFFLILVLLVSVDGRFSSSVSIRGIGSSSVENLAAACLQVTDFRNLRSFSEDLDTLDASLLLLLSHAGQVELQVAKHCALRVV